MPNWVYNTITATGKPEDIKNFMEKAGKPYTTRYPKVTYQNGEKLSEPDTQEVSEPFLFWNFLRPTDEELPYYFGELVKPEEEGVDNPYGSDWYGWNINNWGVKWDCGEVGLYPELDDLDLTKPEVSLNISFATAWGIPEGAFVAIIQQHPELDFDFECEEEQGWGATYTASEVEEGEERTLITTDEWDIPDSHADYVKRGRECNCETEDDEEYWYDDCPRSEKDFYVVVTKTYRVKAVSAENAWNLAIENEDNLDDLAEVMEDETSTWVKDEDGSRAFPNFDTDEDGSPCGHHFVPVYEKKDGVETLVETSCVFCHEVKEDGSL
jgi:hypothetical protein